MTDLKTIGGSFFALSLAKNDIETDDGLETAVALSLFTDRIIEDEEERLEGVSGRGGFWGDQFLASPMGSRLWLLKRSKRTADVLPVAEQYAQEALAWITEEGIAERVEVSAEFDNRALLLSVSIERGELSKVLKFSQNWTGLNE